MMAAEGIYELNVGSNNDNTLDWQNEYVTLDEMNISSEISS